MDSLAIAIKGDIRDLPPGLSTVGLDDPALSEKYLMKLPAEQAAIEFRLRFDKWSSRRLGTLRNYSGLTLKQVITYCETSPHILMSPNFNALGEIFYGMRWRIMEDHESALHYENNKARYLLMMQSMPMRHKYSKDVLDYFLSFYKRGPS